MIYFSPTYFIVEAKSKNLEKHVFRIFYTFCDTKNMKIHTKVSFGPSVQLVGEFVLSTIQIFVSLTVYERICLHLDFDALGIPPDVHYFR